jgi:hypothetical protein
VKKLGIDVPSERTCHRWLAKEKAAFDLPPEKDGQDGYTPVRSMSHIAGLLVQVEQDRLAAKKVESRWHEKQIPGARDQHYTGGLKRPGGVKRKQIEVPAEVAVDEPEGWKESKKREGEG